MQKAAKQTAKRNSYILNRTHVITAAIHAFFLLCRVVIFRSSSSVSSLVKYTILSAPALVIECIFELNGRPKYTSYAASAELRRSGDDLEAKGLTEWMWDVLYWTWGCTVLVALVGDWAWWLYVSFHKIHIVILALAANKHICSEGHCPTVVDLACIHNLW